MTLQITRRTSLALAFAGVSSFLTACGSGGGSASGGGATAWSASTSNETYVPNSIDAWNKANPDTKIEIQYFAGSAYNDKIRPAVGSGNAPTLIWSWAGAPLASYVKNKQVVDLTAQTADLLSRITPSVVEAGKIDGKVYAVPNNQSQPVLLYMNKDLFTQAGVAVPETWEQLLAAVDTFNSKGITPFALAGQSKWPELFWLQYLVDRIGGPEVFQNILDNKPDAWSDPAVLESLKMIEQLVDAGAFVDSFASVSVDSNADLALVHTGKAAMVLQGSWAYATFKADAPDFVSSERIGYASFPTVSGGKGDPTNIVGGLSNYWSVFADASPEAQKAAIGYLTQEVLTDSYVQTMIDNGSVPPVLGAEDKIAASKDTGFLTFAYGLVINSPHFQLGWDQALSPAATTAVYANTDRVFLGQATPEEFIDAMNATIE